MGLLLYVVRSRCQGQEMPVPPDVQSSLFARILPFDRTLGKNDKDESVIGVLFQSKVRGSWTAKDEFMAAVQNLRSAAGGLTLRCVAIEVDNAVDVSQAISSNNLAALYVTPLRAVAMETITTISRNKRVITLTGVPEYAEKGIAIAIGLRGERPLIIVNLPAARAEGADLSSQLLKVAKVIQ